MVEQPPRAQAGDEAARIDPYLAIADQLNQQLSLSEGLRQQRANQYNNLKSYTSGAGSQAVQTLADPTNRAEGQSPVQGLTASVNLNDAFSSQLDKSLQEQEAAGNTVLSTLTALLSVQKAKADEIGAVEDRKLRQREIDLAEKKYKSELAAQGITVDDDGSIKIDGSLIDPTTQAYVDQLQNGTIKNISNIPTEQRDKVVRALSAQGVDVNKLTRQREGEAAAGIVSELYKSYYGQEGASDDLSQGRYGGTLSKLTAGLGLNDKVSSYRKFRDGIVASLKAAVGDSGVLTDQDVERIKGLIPDVDATPGEAEASWNKIDALMQKKYGLSIKTTPAQSQSLQVGGYQVEVE